MIHFRPNNQFDPRRKSSVTSCGKYIYYDVQKWSEDLLEVTCAECRRIIVTTKNREQREARALQEDTGWSYCQCLDLVRTKTEAEIDALVAERKKKETKT